MNGRKRGRGGGEGGKGRRRMNRRKRRREGMGRGTTNTHYTGLRGMLHNEEDEWKEEKKGRGGGAGLLIHITRCREAVPREPWRPQQGPGAEPLVGVKFRSILTS